MHDTTMDTNHSLLLFQFGQVAPQGRRRHTQGLEERTDRKPFIYLEQPVDGFKAFLSEHERI